MNPRTLTAAFMGQLVMVDGIVTRCMLLFITCLVAAHWRYTHYFAFGGGCSAFAWGGVCVQ